MRVFVAGATGAIGKQLVPLLVAAGHEVFGMTHSEANRALKQAGFFVRTVIVPGAGHFWMSDPLEDAAGFPAALAPKIPCISVADSARP